MKHIPLPADQILGDKSISSMFLASNDSIKPKSPPRNRCGRESKDPVTRKDSDRLPSGSGDVLASAKTRPTGTSRHNEPFSGLW